MRAVSSRTESLRKFTSLLDADGNADDRRHVQPMMGALIALVMAIALLAISKISPVWNRVMSPAESALHVSCPV